MSESRSKRPGWVRWSGLAIPVILACAFGWGMQQDMDPLRLILFVLILLLAPSVAYYFALRATKPPAQDPDDEDGAAPLM